MRTLHMSFTDTNEPGSAVSATFDLPTEGMESILYNVRRFCKLLTNADATVDEYFPDRDDEYYDAAYRGSDFD